MKPLYLVKKRAKKTICKVVFVRGYFRPVHLPLYPIKYLEFIRTWLCFYFKKLKTKILDALNSPTDDVG